MKNENLGNVFVRFPLVVSAIFGSAALSAWALACVLQACIG